MEKMRIMAEDCMPFWYYTIEWDNGEVHRHVESEIRPWAGRLSFSPCDYEKNGVVNWKGSTSLHLPHGSTITGMTVRGRVASHALAIRASINQVPNGSHPPGLDFAAQYCKDSTLCGLWLYPGVNGGYIHHEASVGNISHKVDLVNNSYMVSIEFVVWRDSYPYGVHMWDVGYVTDVEVQYLLPVEKTITPVTIAVPKLKAMDAMVKDLRKLRRERPLVLKELSRRSSTKGVRPRRKTPR